MTTSLNISQRKDEGNKMEYIRFDVRMYLTYVYWGPLRGEKKKTFPRILPLSFLSGFGHYSANYAIPIVAVMHPTKTIAEKQKGRKANAGKRFPITTTIKQAVKNIRLNAVFIDSWRLYSRRNIATANFDLDSIRSNCLKSTKWLPLKLKKREFAKSGSL